MIIALVYKGRGLSGLPKKFDRDGQREHACSLQAKVTAFFDETERWCRIVRCCERRRLYHAADKKFISMVALISFIISYFLYIRAADAEAVGDYPLGMFFSTV